MQAVSAIAFVAAVVVQARWPLTLAVTQWILTVLFCFGADIIGEIEHQARMLFLQGMEVLSKGAMLRGVVEDSFDGIAITDERGVVEIFNHSAAHMLGRPAEEAVGTRIAALLPLPPELAAALDQADRVRTASPRRARSSWPRTTAPRSRSSSWCPPRTSGRSAAGAAARPTGARS